MPPASTSPLAATPPTLCLDGLIMQANAIYNNARTFHDSYAHLANNLTVIAIVSLLNFTSFDLYCIPL